MPWLEPLPDVSGDPADPSTIVSTRESVRLAFVAALQHLSPRQRAVLVLRDVLQWKAAEVADAIGTSTAAVNSLLQRARSQLEAAGPSADDRLSAPESADAQDRLTRYIAAFEAYDIDRLVGPVHQRGDLGDATVPRLVSGTAGHRHADSSAVPGRHARRHAADPVDRQRTARRCDVHARRRRPSCRSSCMCWTCGPTECPVWWLSSTPRCSRNSACLSAFDLSTVEWPAVSRNSARHLRYLTITGSQLCSDHCRTGAAGLQEPTVDEFRHGFQSVSQTRHQRDSRRAP